MIIESLPDARELRDHWWWRPGWSVGTRWITWHLTFEGQSDLHRLAGDLQSALVPFTTLDPVPPQWLHLTMAGVAPATELGADQADAVVESVKTALSGRPPLRLTFDRVLLLAESACLLPEPVDELKDLQARIVEIIDDVVRAGVAGEKTHDFLPHLSLAYVNAPQPADVILGALAAVDTAPAVDVAPMLSLIEIHRDNRLYEWRTLAALRV